MRKAAPLLVIAATLLWGAMGVVTRYVSGLGFSLLQTAAVRICCAAAALFVVVLVTDRKALVIRREDLKWFLLSGVGSLMVNNLAYAAAVQRASLSVAVILLYTAPFYVMFLSRFLFGERITPRKVAALLLSFAGCVLTVGISGASLKDPVWLTLLTGLCAGLGYSLYSIFGKMLTGKYKASTVTLYTFLIAAAGTLAVAGPAQTVQAAAQKGPQMLPVFLGSALTLGAPYFLYSAGLARMESSRASILASFEVAAASIYGALFYGEHLTWIHVAGICLVTGALMLLQTGKAKKTP